MNLNLLRRRIGQVFMFVAMSAFAMSANAQQVSNANLDAEAAFAHEANNHKSFHVAASMGHMFNTASKSAAQWDQQLNFDVAAATGAGGQAGVIWTGTEFWVSRWQQDSLFSFDTAGTLLSRFVIPTISQTRGMTKDAAGNIWVGNATGQMFQVNSTTKMVMSTVSLPAGVTARFITFDGTADGGNGGFYVGNFNTDITLVSMTGATLATIASGTHTLGGMYGAAVDNISLGGPYLWVFFQPGNPGATISQLALPGGTPTGVTFDVLTDLGATGLAGGMFIDSTIIANENTIGILFQGTNIGDAIVCYELDYAPFLHDAGIESMVPTPGVSRVPLDHLTSYTFSGDFRSIGSGNLNNVTAKVEISDGSSVIFVDSTNFINVLPGAITAFSSAAWTPPGLGTYDVTATVNLAAGAQVDQDPSNDSASVRIMVTDSTFARDDNTITGSVSINQQGGGTTPALGIIGQEYSLLTTDDLRSISFQLNAPVLGEVITASVRDMPNGIPSNVDLGETVGYTITAGDVANGVFLTLPLSPNSINLPAGKFYVGVNEPDIWPISLATSVNYFENGVTWLNWAGNPNGIFSNFEAFAFNFVCILRPNFGNPFVGINDVDKNNVLKMELFPNPSNGVFTVDVEWEKNDAVEVFIYDMHGKMVFQDKAVNSTSYKQVVDLSGKAAGNYVLRVVNTAGPNVMPFVIE